MPQRPQTISLAKLQWSKMLDPEQRIQRAAMHDEFRRWGIATALGFIIVNVTENLILGNGGWRLSVIMGLAILWLLSELGLRGKTTIPSDDFVETSRGPSFALLRLKARFVIMAQIAAIAALASLYPDKRTTISYGGMVGLGVLTMTFAVLLAIRPWAARLEAQD